MLMMCGHNIRHWGDNGTTSHQHNHFGGRLHRYQKHGLYVHIRLDVHTSCWGEHKINNSALCDLVIPPSELQSLWWRTLHEGQQTGMQCSCTPERMEWRAQGTWRTTPRGLSETDQSQMKGETMLVERWQPLTIYANLILFTSRPG
jgi:hypothetical protein